MIKILDKVKLFSYLVVQYKYIPEMQWNAYVDDFMIHIESSNQGDQKALFLSVTKPDGKTKHVATITLK